MADGETFAFTPEVEAETRRVWDKVRDHVTPMEWRVQAPLIAEINRAEEARRTPSSWPTTT